MNQTFFKIGDKIVVATSEAAKVYEAVVTKQAIYNGVVVLWIDNKHLPEDCLYAVFAWPIAVKEELLEILGRRARLKKEYDDSMSLIYELRNKIVRGEVK